MPLPRFRLRTLMIAVAVAAVFVGIPLHWATWLGKVKRIPISAGLHAQPLRPSQADLAGKTAPLEIEYDFGLGSPKPPPGMFLRLRGETKVEDRGTGAIVSRYTFHRLLISGVREESSGTIPWRIKRPRPGQYRIRYEVSYMNPFGTWTRLLSGSGRYDVHAPVAADPPREK